MASVKDIAGSRYDIPTSINGLARAFDYPRESVNSALAHGLDEPGHRGKHAAIDGDRERKTPDWVRQNAE
jgi:hypothetical protein